MWGTPKKEEEEPQPGTEPWDDTRLEDLDYGDEQDDDEEEEEEEEED